MLKLAFSSHICTTSLKSFTSLRSTAKPRSTMLQWYLLLVSSWLCSFPCLCSVFLHFVCFFSSFFSYAINFETFFYLILLPYSELSLFIFSSKWGARKWVTFYQRIKLDLSWCLNFHVNVYFSHFRFFATFLPLLVYDLRFLP